MFHLLAQGDPNATDPVGQSVKMASEVWTQVSGYLATNGLTLDDGQPNSPRDCCRRP